MFTYFLIAAAVVLLVAIVVHEIRSRKKIGHHISQNAPLGSEGMNNARMIHGTNIHDGGPFDTPGSM